MLPVIVSTANAGYGDLARNLVLNAQRVLKNHRFVFYCMDQQLFDMLKPLGTDRIEIRAFGAACSKDFREYNASGFQEITHAKLRVASAALGEFGFVHFVDADVVFLKEPTAEYHAAYNDYDIVFQRDMAPCEGGACATWTCVGDMVLRNTEATRKHLERLQQYALRTGNNDQECQRQMFEEAGVTDIRLYPHAKFTEFPIEDFALGWVANNAPHLIPNLMVFHANCVMGKQAKIELLKKVGGWFH
jgi:hypothetical protein